MGMVGTERFLFDRQRNLSAVGSRPDAVVDIAKTALMTISDLGSDGSDPRAGPTLPRALIWPAP
jgi:hypothetical protein